MVSQRQNAENSTCDLEFNDGIENTWIRKAALMDVAVKENYWSDETIQYALENGGLIEYE